VRTVRDATLEALRRLGTTTLFANPGSTEIPFLADLPDDFHFVLGLHESSVVGMATGYALASGRPALVNLHTVAGLGNAVSALATARQNRAPLVVLVGQQDRRHLALEPFLAGRLDDLAGSYPVSVQQPTRAADVPGAVVRAYHDAAGNPRGPALVIVPMDDWEHPADEAEVDAAALRVVRTAGVDEAALAEVADELSAARSPLLVVGAGADEPTTWRALTVLAERLGAPVWQEAFGARAGFPQDHPHFAGHLPASRDQLRTVFEGHDLVLVVGAPVFRQYPYRPGPLVPEGTRVVQLTEDPAEAHRSPVDLSVLTPLSGFVAALAEKVSPRTGWVLPERTRPRVPPLDAGGPLLPEQLFAVLAERLPADTVVVEESPSSRSMLHALLPARSPLGFLSAANGGLGFAMPAATGVRMAAPRRPVVCIVGDGSSLYSVQTLWSAARYGAGVLFVVLANGGYAILDRLVEMHGNGGAKAPWPHFDQVDVATIAAGFGCRVRRVSEGGQLLQVLDEVLPGLAERTEPLVLVVDVSPGTTY